MKPYPNNQNLKTDYIINLSIPANINFSSALREFSKKVFETSGFNEKWQDRLKLVCDELFMNAVNYGSDVNSIIEIQFQILETKIIFIIKDEGKNKVTAKTLKEIVNKNKENSRLKDISGRGLAMITSMWTDNFDIEDNELGGITIKFTKNYLNQATDINNKKDLADKENIVKFSGDITLPNIDDKNKYMENIINKDIHDTVITLDFDQLSYINSVFIGSIANWYNKLINKGNTLKIINANKNIIDILKTVGLSKIIDIQPKN